MVDNGLSKEREGRVTGSQAGAILGLCPWRSREDVMHDWLYGSQFKGNVATEYGKFYEEYALEDLKAYLGEDIKPSSEFYIAKDHEWLGATPDAVGDIYVCEIKCPYSMRNETDANKFKSLEQQPHYYAQVQIEMLCTGKPKAYFFQWSPNGIQSIETVYQDQEWLDENIPKLFAFWLEWHERKQSLEPDEDLAIQYHILKLEYDAAKKALDDHKELMIELANGQKRKFGDVSVYPVERKGSIPYAKVLKEHLPDIDLEPYRGEPSVSWVVK